MSKREEFIDVINIFKTVSPSITDVQRRGLLKQAVQNYGIPVEEASKILKSLGLVVGEEINYFEILALSMEEIQELDEQTIVSIVEAAHEHHYRASLRAGARIRPDGKTEEQWRNTLNQARETLIDTQKRKEYVATLLLQDDLSEVVPNALSQAVNEFDTPEPTPANEIETISSSDSVLTASSFDVSNDMVLIPAGEFEMRSRSENRDGGEITTHTVYLGTFFMDKYPVTNAQYQVFLDSNPQWQKKQIPKIYHDGNYLQTWSGNNYPRGKADHPVVDVSWYAAMAYAQWSDKRLPTETEWEKAARGGLIGKTYPRGDKIDSDIANYSMHVGRTTPVGEYPPNDYGVYDAVGNVWEWCLDEYNHRSSDQNPGLSAESVSEITTNFLSITSDRVLRGGSWASSDRAALSFFDVKLPLLSQSWASSDRAARVDYCGWADPIIAYYSYGFRCVKDITP